MKLKGIFCILLLAKQVKKKELTLKNILFN